jgi:hypothetical protein
MTRLRAVRRDDSEESDEDESTVQEHGRAEHEPGNEGEHQGNSRKTKREKAGAGRPRSSRRDDGVTYRRHVDVDNDE